MNKWECIETLCNWKGDNPDHVDPYDDGGWHVCPECGEGAVLNFNHPENQKKYAEALWRSNT